MAAETLTPTLALPEPGTIGLVRDFMDPEIVEAANAAEFPPDNRPHRYVLTKVHKENQLLLARDLERGSEWPEALIAMTDKVVGAATFTWQSLSVYIRRLTSLRSEMDTHKDGGFDARVLIEGNGSEWFFDEPPLSQQHPNGLPLGPTDAALLNNRCARDLLVSHGVRLPRKNVEAAKPADDNPIIRKGYLFIFS